eukprot:4118753-Pyramimonas_sp.AAC.1
MWASTLPAHLGVAWASKKSCATFSGLSVSPVSPMAKRISAAVQSDACQAWNIAPTVSSAAKFGEAGNM